MAVVFGAAALLLLVVAVAQIAATAGTVPLAAGAIALAGWLMKTVVEAIPVLLLLGVLLGLAAMSPWFLLGGLTLLITGGGR